MRELLLWRHAKSSWATPGMDDLQRPLNRRGHRSAEAVARWLVTRHLVPDHVLCSPARRTRETAEHLMTAMPEVGRIEMDRKVYLAEADELLDRIRRVPGTARRVMLIGHNEGLGQLAQQLAKRGPADQLASLKAKYPTGALTWLRFPDSEWSALDINAGELVHFVRPRDLLEEQP